jgi:hypothetical protein
LAAGRKDITMSKSIKNTGLLVGGMFVKEPRQNFFSVAKYVHENQNADVRKIGRKTGLSRASVGRILRALDNLGVLRNRLLNNPWIDFSILIRPPLGFCGWIFLMDSKNPNFEILEEDTIVWIKNNIEKNEIGKNIIIETGIILVAREFRIMLRLYTLENSDIYAFEHFLSKNPAITFKRPLFIVHSASLPA